MKLHYTTLIVGESKCFSSDVSLVLDFTALDLL
jgi:hypothetical protein